MPVIKMEYDETKLSDEETERLAKAAQEIVSDITGIKDVFVYGNSAKIKVQVAPVEIFVEMSDFKIKDLDELTASIKLRLSSWKERSGFTAPINLTVIPMHWKVEIAI